MSEVLALGQLAGSPVWTSGQQGGVLRLDSLDDHVWISDSASLEVSGTLTLEAWVYPESLTDEQVLFAYELMLDQGRLRVRLSGDGC